MVPIRRREQAEPDPTPKPRAVALKNWVHRATDTAEGFATAFSILHGHGLQPIGSGTTRKVEGGKELLYLTIHFCCDDATFNAVFFELQRRVHSSIGIEKVDLHQVMGHYTAEVKGMTTEEKMRLQRKPLEADVVERIIVFCSTRMLRSLQTIFREDCGISVARTHEMRRPERIPGSEDFGLWKLKMNNLTQEQRADAADILSSQQDVHWKMGDKTTVHEEGNLVTLGRLDKHLVDTFGNRLLERNFGPPGTNIKTHGPQQSA
jgi:hypothetical protein